MDKVNRSAFCREYIAKVGVGEVTYKGMCLAWIAAGHSPDDVPTGTLFYRQKKRIPIKPLKHDVPQNNNQSEGGLYQIELQLEKLTKQAYNLGSRKLSKSIRQALRQAGVAILAQS